MSETLQAAARLREVIAAFDHRSMLRQEPACAVYARTLAEPGSARAHRSEDLVAFRSRVLDLIATVGSEGIDAAAWRNLPDVLWFGGPQERLARLHPWLWRDYLDRLRRSPHRATVAIEAWLRDFDTGDESISGAGRDIAAGIERSDVPRLDFWLQAHRAYSIFKADTGPRCVAEAILDLRKPRDDTLRNSGMDDVLRSQGGFFRQVSIEMLGRLPNAFRRPQADITWSRLQPLISAERSVRNLHGKPIQHLDIRWSDADVDAIVGANCLEAWKTNSAHFSAPRERVMQFLLMVLGDPRLRPQRWQRVDAACRDVMCRWLSEKHLEAFLDLISAGNDTTQWRYRAAFWRACFRKAPDAQVWIVLGPDLAGRAGSVKELAGHYGRMSTSGQGVLLMRLGSLVLSEWSHIGALRAWDYTDHRCPVLYLPQERPYSIGEEDRGLRANSLQFADATGVQRAGSRYGLRGLSHYNPEQGTWQKRAADMIREKTGISLTPADYMPR